MATPKNSFDEPSPTLQKIMAETFSTCNGIPFTYDPEGLKQIHKIAQRLVEERLQENQKET